VAIGGGASEGVEKRAFLHRPEVLPSHRYRE
jgi:hypothetical protein